MLSHVLIQNSEVPLTPATPRWWDASQTAALVVDPRNLARHGFAITPEAACCRDVAARLAGFALQRRNPEAPLPATINYSMLAPSTRTSSEVTWDLGQAATLHLELPSPSSLSFKLRLSAGHGTFKLHPRTAERWASALVTVAALLDDAYVHITTTLNQRWSGHTTADQLVSYLDAAEPDLDPAQRELADQLRRILSDERDAAHTALATAAFDADNPDLPVTLRDLFHRDNLGHRAAAEVMLRLARKYHVPFYKLTADDPEVHNALVHNGAGTAPLTETQWRRLANAREVRELPDRIHHDITFGTLLHDMEYELVRAGVLCRGPIDEPGGCSRRLDDELTVTWGRCEEHRPETLAAAIAAPCPNGDPHDHEHTDGGETPYCWVCYLPLTDDGAPSTADTSHQAPAPE